MQRAWPCGLARFAQCLLRHPVPPPRFQVYGVGFRVYKVQGIGLGVRVQGLGYTETLNPKPKLGFRV